jgi:glycosyltransferase involved in cell wall biosynthesis
MKVTYQGRKLRVGLDGFNLALLRGTGIATYARTLSHGLSAAGCHVDVLYGMNIAPHASAMMREMVFFDSLERELKRRAPAPLSRAWFREIFRKPSAIEVPITGSVVREGFAGRLPAFDRILNVADLFRVADRYFRRTGKFLPIRVSDPPDIMHWTYPLPITVVGAKNIYTLHDLIPLRLPYTTLDDKGFYLRLIRGCLRHGDHICTVSEASRRDIMELFNVAPEKVTNTYQSIVLPPQASRATEADIADQVRGLFGLDYQGYFLFFGAIEPKKNIGRMIEAYLSARLATRLVLVGSQGWRSEQELRLIEGSNTHFLGDSGVRRIDYLPVAMLMSLVRGAKAVLFPSLYEGFGLPALEAMALGTPTLTSTTAALPEIAGDATVAVDPYDVGAMTEALRRLDGDAALCSELAARGLRQAEKFSMAQYQQRLLAMYRVVLG